MGLVSKSEAAAITGCCEKTLERHIAEGALVATSEHGRVVIDRAELDRWILARQSRGRRTSPLSNALEFSRRIVALETRGEVEAAQ